MIGMGAGRLVGTRLAFHAFDGLLAADALHPRIRRHYMAAWHGVGLTLLALVTLIARPSLLVVSVPAYLTGVLVAGLTDGFKIPTHIVGTTRPGWTLRAWSHRPIAGVAAATVLLLALLPARTLGTNALMAVVGIGTVLLALILTSVDDAIVRFMTIAGHGSRHIIARHIRGLASFLAVAVSACWVMLGPIAGWHRCCRVRRDDAAREPARTCLPAARQAVRRSPRLHSRRTAHAGRILDARGFARYRSRHVLAIATPGAGQDVAAGMNLAVELDRCSSSSGADSASCRTSDLTDRTRIVVRPHRRQRIGEDQPAQGACWPAALRRRIMPDRTVRNWSTIVPLARCAFGFFPSGRQAAGCACRGRDVLELVGGSINDVRSRLGKAAMKRWAWLRCSTAGSGTALPGMRQRIAIAAAFRGRSIRLVILDEPFNWLDPVAIFDLREALRDIVAGGLTLDHRSP